MGHHFEPAPQADPGPGPGGTTETLPSSLVWLMAVASGAVVANLYYAQPLLHEVAATFSVGSSAASIVITCTQVGYAAGLLLVVPVGDLRPRRDLVPLLFALASTGLVVCAIAPSLWLFEIGAVVTGVLSVAAQLLVPFAADLAAPAHRGRVVARIMTGLLLGILLARTLSGLVAQAAGWRAIYWVSAGLMVALAAVLRRLLPDEADRQALPYRHLVASTLRLLATLPVLRRRAWHGAMAFAAFSVLWTSLAFLLSGAPYHYSDAVIGLFGLAGVAGVAAANVAGRQADADRHALSTAVAGVLLVGSFALLAAGRTSLGALLVGIVVLDIGTQGMQITNQAVIYSLGARSRSRLNSAYMLCYFAGGAVGSVSAGFVLARWGWTAVCLLGGVYGAGSLGLAALDRWRTTPSGAPAPHRRDSIAVDPFDLAVPPPVRGTPGG